MKIVCTLKEYARMIRICEGRKTYDTDSCCGCVMKGYCPDDGGIEDSGIVEMQSSEEG